MMLSLSSGAMVDVDAAHLIMRARHRRRRLVLGSAIALLACAAVISISVGATGVSIGALPRVLLGSDVAIASQDRLVLLDIRLPRTLLAALVGAMLAVAGAMMQGLFRNPLADPGLIGVSSGAALAAVTVIVLGHGIARDVVSMLGIHALPIAAFVGGVAVTGILVLISRAREGISISGLLLAGLVIGALAQALMGLIAYVSDERELRDLTLWTMGSLAGSSWTKVMGILPFAALVLLLLPSLMRGLNGLLLGEAEAFYLGIDVERMKWLVIVATAASVGAAVAAAGIIGFVGVIVPHMVRLLVGPDHGTLLPASAVLGAALVILADIVARTVVAPAELPLGIVIALMGAPVFLHLVLRRGAHV